jgi:hypothetical protein
LPSDSLAQPTGKGPFDFHLRSGAGKVIYGFHILSKKSEPTRRNLRLKLKRHKLHHWTFSARVGPNWIIEIEQVEESSKT